MATIPRTDPHRTPTEAPAILPLENGDRLDAKEFLRRYEAMPELTKAELIDGRVYIPCDYRGRILDPSIPPLENGDRLTRDEFERRNENMSDLKKAELIEGVVYMNAAVRAMQHGHPHSRLIGWLFVYEAATPGVQVADNSTVVLGDSNEPQPDGFLRVLPKCGGQSGTTAKGYIDGAPELVAEIASSSVTYDLHEKLDVYRRHGAREYLVWKVLERSVVWFVLRDGEYKPLVPDASGWLRSDVFPGLWLDVPSLLGGKSAQVLKVLQQGLESPEHAAYVARLQSMSDDTL